MTYFLFVKSKIMMRFRRYILLKNMFSLKINNKLPLEKCVYLLWKVLAAWFLTQGLKMTSNFVSAHGSHHAQIWLKGVDIKNPPLFYLVCLRSFGSCDDICDHE